MKSLFSERTIAKSLQLQHDQSDCGVACLLSLIRLYGGTSTLENLRELSGTTKEGTTLLGLYQSAHQLGFDAQGCESDIKGLIAHGQPVILHVVLEERLQHYVVCYGYENDQFVIGDPANGIAYYREEELLAIWKSKKCLVLTPNGSFITSKVAQSFKRAWFWNLVKEDKPLLIFSMVLGLFIAILGMVMAVFSQKLIDEILPSKDWEKLITGIILVAFLLLIKVLFSILRGYFMMRQNKDFNNRIVNSFYSNLLVLPKPFFDTRKIGELVSRLNDTERIQGVISRVVNGVIVNLLTTIVSVVFLFYYAWQIGLLASCCLPFYFILLYSFNQKIIKTQRITMQSDALAQSNYIATISGIAAIKTNNKYAIFQDMHQLIYGNYQDKVFELGKINIRLSLFSGVFGVVFLIGILSYTAIQVYHELLQIGELMAILRVAGALLPAVGSIAMIAIPINEAKVAFDRMYEFTVLSKEKTGTQKLSALDSFEMKALSFRFVGRKPLLNDINLAVCKGECVVIVGESGSGKSTLGQLAERFLEPEQGSVVINGDCFLKDIELSSWRSLLGVVAQEITLFNGTLLDNITMGTPDTPEHVLGFCKSFGFDAYFEQLPQGYLTLLGEEGVKVSGGQRQLIGLSRALYKKPQFLILDEFTSAMDSNTEGFALQLINRIKEETAILMISHRLHSLPKIADRIYVLEQGTISHAGSHKELLNSTNFYSAFWREILG